MRIVFGLLLGGLLAMAYSVLKYFLVPVAWAAIMAYATWPLYARIEGWLGGRLPPLGRPGWRPSPRYRCRGPVLGSPA